MIFSFRHLILLALSKKNSSERVPSNAKFWLWFHVQPQRRWPLCLPSATPPPPPTPHLGPHRLLPARHTHNAWGWVDAIGPWARKQSPGWWWCQGGLSDVDRLHRCCRIHGVARLQPLWDGIPLSFFPERTKNLVSSSFLNKVQPASYLMGTVSELFSSANAL